MKSFIRLFMAFIFFLNSHHFLMAMVSADDLAPKYIQERSMEDSSTNIVQSCFNLTGQMPKFLQTLLYLPLVIFMLPLLLQYLNMG